jgi:hypothetical protein
MIAIVQNGGGVFGRGSGVVMEERHADSEDSPATGGLGGGPRPSATDPTRTTAEDHASL